MFAKEHTDHTLAVPGMAQYTRTLRRITKKSNNLLLSIVEDLTAVYADGKENLWVPAEIEVSRKKILQEFIDHRNAFVFENQEILLGALGVEDETMIEEELEAIAVPA